MLRQLPYLFLVASLGTAAVAYQVKGHYLLVWGEHVSDAVDLHLRWKEQHHFFRGYNPFDFHPVEPEIEGGSIVPPGLSADQIEQMNKIGLVHPAHPPWGYAVGSILLWPNWPAARTYYSLLNLLACVVIAYWAFSQGRTIRGRTSDAVLLALAAMAISANCTAISVGQYGVIVTAFLAMAVWSMDRSADSSAGLFVGLASVKPTIAAPFFLPLLFQRKYRAFAVASLYCIAGSLLTWGVTKVDPLTMLRGLSQMGAKFIDAGTVAPIHLFLVTFDSRELAMFASLAVVMIPAIIALWLLRKSDHLSAFAVAAVAGRLWTYHKSYDNIMLVFLLVALGRQTLATSSLWRWAAFLAVGASLWTPPSLVTREMQWAQLAIWVMGAIVVTYDGMATSAREESEGFEASANEDQDNDR